MRSGILCTLLFFVFVYLLRFPEDAFQASASGVTLWFFHVLPSLLPFMILSDFFIHTGLASVLLQKTKRQGKSTDSNQNKYHSRR